MDIHIFFAFVRMFCHDHVLSLNLKFESLVEKVTLDKNISILSKSSDDGLLPLLITMHALAKHELNSL